MADNFDVIVDFSMNEDANRRVSQGVTNIEQELKDLEEQAKKTGRRLEDVLSDNLDNLRKWVDEAERGYHRVGEAQRKQAEEAAKSARAQASLFSAEASMLNARVRAYTIQSAELQRVQAQVASFGRTMLVAGTALAGGIFKLADDFVKNAPHATRLTVQWKEAQDSLSQSMSRVGRVSAQAALPILQKVAELAEKTASFIESHPDLVRAALNTGIITAGLGALGILVSRGIKLYADILYLQAIPLQQEAARLQFLASEQMLVAARLQAEATGADVLEDIPIGGAGKGLGGKAAPFLALLGQGAVLLGSFAAGLLVADKAFDNIEKRDVTFNDYITTFKQALAIDAKKFGDWLEGIGIRTPSGNRMLFQSDTGEQMFERVGRALGLLKDDADEAAASLDDLSGSLRNSPAFEKVLDAYEDYRNDDLELVRDHYAKRQSITDDALAAELASNRRYASSVSKINADTGKALANLQQDYERDRIKAEQDYYKQRNDILQDASDDVKRIEEDLQETLRKNAQEHSDRTADIIASRDALALVKENRRFEQQQAEERRQANLEIRRLRQDLAKRLQELEAEYLAERALRYQEYVQRAIEIKQQAAERLAELRLQHQEELRQIREQKAQRLKEEDEQFLAERRRRYEYFVAQIRDLDASLLGERNLRLQYQEAMITDLEAFLSRYKAGLGSLNAVPVPPGRAAGNYTSGLVMTGEKGYEWIATHKSTTEAEKILGGRLTQETFVNAMKALRAANQATYVDNRRLEVPMSKETKEAYKQGAIAAMKEMLGV